jgi:hypothetical protein
LGTRIRTDRAKQIEALSTSKKRDKKRKAGRLRRAAEKRQLQREIKATRLFANIVAIRDVKTTLSDEGKAEKTGSTVFGVRVGLFGHPTTTILRIPDEKAVGAVEDTKEMGEIVTQLGLLTLGALLKFNLAGGPEALAKAYARWCGIDLEALKREADEEALEKVRADIEAQKVVTDAATDAATDAVPQ